MNDEGIEHKSNPDSLEPSPQNQSGPNSATLVPSQGPA